MAKNAKISALAAVLILLASCGKGSSDVQAPELLRAIPSDALGLVCFDRCDEGLEFALDSAHVLRSLETGRLSGAHMVMSIDNVGSVEPLLVIDAGHASPDTSEAARRLLGQAAGAGVHAAFVCGSDSTIRRNVLLLSPSETVVSVALRHIGASTSILDAPGFDKVLECQGATRNAVILRNSGSRKLLSSDMLDRFVAHPALSDFLRGYSDWVVVDAGDAGHGRFNVATVQDASSKYFANLVGNMEPAPSKLQGALPAAASFVVDMPVRDMAAFREAYESWLDASSSLTRYRKRLTSLRKEYGKDPLCWEQELGVREVARACMSDGLSVTMVRSQHAPSLQGICRNPYPGFAAALFGSAFSSPADTCAAAMGDWTITGSEAAVSAFAGAEERLGAEMPKNSKFTIWTPSFSLEGLKEGISLTVNKI